MIDHIDGLAGQLEKQVIDMLNKDAETLEAEHDGSEDAREEAESQDRWLEAEEDRYLSGFSE